MSKTVDRCHQRVDAFVAAVNSSRRVPLFLEEIPEPCRLGPVEEGWPDVLHWQIIGGKEPEWLREIETRLPFRLPSTLRSLIARYSFPSFEAGPLTFYSVGLNDMDSGSTEFRWAIFADSFMSPFLMKNGLIPFARPADYSYDPVCFDFTKSNRKSEPAVVRINHEEILCNDRLRVVETISPTFHELIEEIARLLKNRPAAGS